jgi:hypothetical protein
MGWRNGRKGSAKVKTDFPLCVSQWLRWARIVPQRKAGRSSKSPLRAGPPKYAAVVHVIRNSQSSAKPNVLEGKRGQGHSRYSLQPCLRYCLLCLVLGYYHPDMSTRRTSGAQELWVPCRLDRRYNSRINGGRGYIESSIDMVTEIAPKRSN